VSANDQTLVLANLSLTDTGHASAIVAQKTGAEVMCVSREGDPSGDKR